MIGTEAKITRIEDRSRWPLLLLALTGIFLVVAWLHYRLVVTPLDYANKDFMSLWTGGRALLRGLNPYDVEVWAPLRAEYGSRWMPDARAPFPLWTFIFMLPFALLPLPVAAAMWLTFQEFSLGLSLWWLVRYVGNYRPSALEVGLLALGSFVSTATILVLVNGQMTYLLLSVLALYLLLVRRERPFAAGVVLALLALKPNPFILFVPFVGLWLLWQRRWHTILGAACGGAVLLLATWAIHPGWLLQWLNVRSKTEVVEITPTLWGLAAELSPNWSLPLGLLLVAGCTAFIAWFVFRRPALDERALFALAISASLLVTPYTWTYEHALLYLPWLWLFTRFRERRTALLTWVFLTWIFPWVVFGFAVARFKDTLGFLVPAATLVAILWLKRREERSSEQEAEGLESPVVVS